LAGYAVVLENKKIAIVGNGRLVGKPLAKMWMNSGYDVTVLTKKSADIASVLRESAVIVTATGVPHLITPAMLSVGAVVVDAGTASEDGFIVGDIDESVRERDDLTITPEKGGVGPLTVAALFDNVINAALATTKKQD
jgi:methylenetetrahydrofolate dehydrogenase (NADP+)/methenyltetrahydrofolate cyclohydrolase